MSRAPTNWEDRCYLHENGLVEDTDPERVSMMLLSHSKTFPWGYAILLRYLIDVDGLSTY